MRHPLPPVLHHTPILWKKNASDPQLKVISDSETKNVFEKIPLLLFLLVTLLANCLTVCAILWAVLSGSNDFARTLNPFQGQIPVCPTLCFAPTKVWIEIRYLWNWAELARDRVEEEDSHWFIVVLIWGLFTMWHVLPRPPYLIRSSVSVRFVELVRCEEGDWHWWIAVTPPILPPALASKLRSFPPFGKQLVIRLSVARSLHTLMLTHHSVAGYSVHNCMQC